MDDGNFFFFMEFYREVFRDFVNILYFEEGMFYGMNIWYEIINFFICVIWWVGIEKKIKIVFYFVFDLWYF